MIKNIVSKYLMQILKFIFGSLILPFGLGSPLYAGLKSYECYDHKKGRIDTVWQDWTPMLTFDSETGQVYKYDIKSKSFNKIKERKFKRDGVDVTNSYSWDLNNDKMIYKVTSTTMDYGVTFDVTNYIYTLDLNTLQTVMDVKARTESYNQTNLLSCIEVKLPSSFKINS
tara:strand:+ start:138 stop:647 length:510 start_codon:yes stop_codon:yes gene_type:complete